MIEQKKTLTASELLLRWNEKLASGEAAAIYKFNVERMGVQMQAFKSRIKMFRGRHKGAEHDLFIMRFDAEDGIKALEYVTQTCEALCSTGRYGFYDRTTPSVSKPRVMSQNTLDALAKARDDKKHGKGLPLAAKEAQKAKAN